MRMSISVSSDYIENIQIGDLRAKRNVAGDRVLRYFIDLRHTVLDLHKEVSAPEISILQNKVDTLIAGWDKKFQAHQKKMALEAGKDLADQMTVEAEEKRNELRNLLRHTLQVDDAVDWNVLKDFSRYKMKVFPEPQPRNPSLIVHIFYRVLGQSAKLKQETEGWHARESVWNEKQARKEQEFKERQVTTNAQVDALRIAWEQGSNAAILEHASIV